MEFDNYKKEEKIIDLAKANGIALIYFTVFAVVFSLPFYLIWGFNFSKESFEQNLPSVFLSIPVIILGIILHELVHGIFFAMYARQGFKSIKFGILWKMLTPYCHCKEPLKIKGYVIALLAPLVLIGLVPSLISLATGNIPLLIFGIFFSGSAAGDLMIFNLIRRENPGDYVQDHPSEAGYYIFRKKS